jgi:hypothetical protein
MTKDTALDLALEALIYASSYCDTYDAITAIKQALAAPVQEPVAVIGSDFQLLYCREDWAKGLKVGDTLCLCTPPAGEKK